MNNKNLPYYYSHSPGKIGPSIVASKYIVWLCRCGGFFKPEERMMGDNLTPLGSPITIRFLLSNPWQWRSADSRWIRFFTTRELGDDDWLNVPAYSMAFNLILPSCGFRCVQSCKRRTNMTANKLLGETNTIRFIGGHRKLEVMQVHHFLDPISLMTCPFGNIPDRQWMLYVPEAASLCISLMNHAFRDIPDRKCLLHVSEALSAL